MGQDDRAERLKVALRENLRRRKAQARGRDAPDAPKDAPEESAAGPDAPAGPKRRPD
jgi:hypothetical protein